MKINSLTLLVALFPILLYAQVAEKIDVADFNQLLMEERLQEAINKKREDRNLPLVLRLTTLDAAAFDQAEYNQKNNTEGHTQSNEDKKDVTLRVKSYGGLHYEMGELIYTATVGLPIKTKPGTAPITINTYEKAAEIALETWMEDEDSKAIILDPSYYSLGVAASINEERQEISIIAVIASPPFDLKGDKDRKDQYALVEYDKSVCDGFNRTNPFLPELLSDKVSIEEDGTIYFENSDRALLSEILGDGRDGFAVDLVAADQFDCEKGNGLYPSNFHEGLLLRPIRGGTVNYKTSEGEYLKKFKLGELPKTYDPNNTNVNLLLFKEAAICTYIPYNKMDAKNLHWIDPKWELRLSDNTKGSILNVEAFPSKQTDKIYSYLDQLKEDAEKINYIKVTYNYSPIIIDSVESITAELNKAIKKDFKISEVIIKNRMDTINQFIANRTIALEMMELNEAEKIDFLKASEDPELKEFLANIHQTEMLIGITEDLVEFPNEKLAQNLSAAIKRNKIESAMTLQSALIKRAQSGDQKAVKMLAPTGIKQTADNLTLISNALVAEIKNNKNPNLSERETLRRNLLGLYLVDKTNEVVAYNLCLSILYAWELGKKAPVTPEKWEEYYKSASANAVIDSEKLKRLSTNFHLLTADYYYDNGNIRERKKSLEAAYSNIITSDNSKEESIMYAQYFMYQLQIKWVADILKKQLKKGFDIALAEQLISIASYPSAEMSEQERNKLLMQIKSSDSNHFCDLFKENKAHYLYLKTPEIKEAWCSSCEN